VPRFEQQTPSGGAPVIEGYAHGGFRVSGTHFPGGVLVTPTRALPWTASLEMLTEGDFEPLFAEPVEVLLLGTGATLRRPAAKLIEALRSRGLAVDPMDSKAAARTYNVLVNEGRLVAAVLLAL
jgi:uncharacterized protein